MQNFVQPGCTLTVPAPRALTPGVGVLVGILFGVSNGTYASGADAELELEGIYELTALSTDTASVGSVAYWDNTNFRITATAGSNTKVGVFAQAKAASATTAVVRLNGSF